MEKKTKSSLEDLVIFGSEKEKELLRWFIIGDVFFLVGSLIIMFVSKAPIMSWSHYWILFITDIVLFSFISFVLIIGFIFWFLKYLVAIYFPLMIIGCSYFAESTNVKLVFAVVSISSSTIIFLFYDLKIFFLYNLIIGVYLGILFFYYSKILPLFSFPEISVIYILFVVISTNSFIFLQRTRTFLAELLEKRKELEEAKGALEIKIKARTKALEELTQNLDQEVKERTQELEKRINELEKFHKLTVGRELRMADLKKEIERLKEENEELKKELESVRA